LKIFRKLLCFLGIHTFEASFREYLDQFGEIPIDGRIADGARCIYCGNIYRRQKEQKEQKIQKMKEKHDIYTI